MLNANAAYVFCGMKSARKSIHTLSSSSSVKQWTKYYEKWSTVFVEHVNFTETAGGALITVENVDP